MDKISRRNFLMAGAGVCGIGSMGQLGCPSAPSTAQLPSIRDVETIVRLETQDNDLDTNVYEDVIFASQSAFVSFNEQDMVSSRKYPNILRVSDSRNSNKYGDSITYMQFNVPNRFNTYTIVGADLVLRLNSDEGAQGKNDFLSRISRNSEPWSQDSLSYNTRTGFGIGSSEFRHSENLPGKELVFDLTKISYNSGMNLFEGWAAEPERNFGLKIIPGDLGHSEPCGTNRICYFNNPGSFRTFERFGNGEPKIIIEYQKFRNF